MKEVLKYLKDNIKENSTLVIACSGGPDSMCLLHLLYRLKDELNLNIVVAHVNHKLRKESDNEALMVKDYANKFDCKFELLEINEYLNSNFTEEDARKRRYRFFDEVINKYNAKYLLTAHHGDDLIETILMRLTRGSNLNGYIGIKEKRINDNYVTLRPLLKVTKDEIIAYLKEQNINYAIDKTNETEEHTRNRYRHNVLPFLKKENPDVHKKYLKFSLELQEYDNFVNEYIMKNEFVVDNKIVVNKVLNESDFIKRKCLELLIKDIQKTDLFDISDNQINELLKLYNLNNKSIDLNNNYKGVNSYGFIELIKKIDDSWNEFILDKDVLVNNLEFFYNTKEGNDSNNCIYLNSKELCMPLKLRPWHDGDKMQVKNMTGTKKVSDIFITEKLAKQKRNTYPILVDSNNQILWIPNIKKSQFAKDKNDFYDIIVRCEER